MLIALAPRWLQSTVQPEFRSEKFGNNCKLDSLQDLRFTAVKAISYSIVTYNCNPIQEGAAELSIDRLMPMHPMEPR